MLSSSSAWFLLKRQLFLLPNYLIKKNCGLLRMVIWFHSFYFLRYFEGWIWLTILEKRVGKIRQGTHKWFSMRESFLPCLEDLLLLIPGMTWRLVKFSAPLVLLLLWMDVNVTLVLSESLKSHILVVRSFLNCQILHILQFYIFG